MVISDIVFKDFTGLVSKKYDPRAGTLVCSSPSVSPSRPPEKPPFSMNLHTYVPLTPWRASLIIYGYP
jgi:hypothetical protein